MKKDTTLRVETSKIMIYPKKKKLRMGKIMNTM